MGLCVNIVKSWVLLKLVVALVTSVYQRLQIPLDALCLGCGQIFPRVFFTVCTLLGLGSSWVVQARSLLCVVLQRESICCNSPSDGPLSLSLNVYQHGVGEMGKPQSQAGTVKVVLGAWN